MIPERCLGCGHPMRIHFGTPDGKYPCSYDVTYTRLTTSGVIGEPVTTRETCQCEDFSPRED